MPFSPVVFQLAVKGALLSVEMAPHVPLKRSNATDATPEPVPSSADAVNGTVPRTFAFVAMPPSATVGTVLSTVMLIAVSASDGLPATSVAIARTWYVPLRPVVSQLAVKGALLSVDSGVHVPLKVSKDTDAAPEPAPSFTEAVKGTVPRTFAFVAIPPSVTVGAVLSTRTLLAVSAIDGLPTRSVAMART